METILTLEFCKEVIRKVSANEDLTAEEARYLIYFEHNPNKCATEGSILRCNCGNDDCVNPDHSEILPPNYQ